MPTIDLTPAPPVVTSALDAAPRRIGLTLSELGVVAELAGGAPLPFEVAAPAESGGLESRLGQSRTTTADQAYRAVVDGLPNPVAALYRRGLVSDGVLDANIAGAVGLLATPRLALDIDIAFGDVQAKAWYRQADGAVASLATVDGIVFELAWFGTEAWPAELARVAAISEELTLDDSAVPAYVDLPFELADAGAEAIRTNRNDLLPVLAGRHSGDVRGADGRALPDDEVTRVITALSTEARGRLRAMVADVPVERVPAAVGVVSWTLLADGWHALRPHRARSGLRVEVSRAEPSALAVVLAPLLAEVQA
ncbi:hypothetical protein [Nocardioides panacisoli]|uniref:Uncharacterized protein n=1 Tax=Nocardioides panacisoli TaxID=627624 RepID=A0ABP7J065_9ACTN